MAKRTQAAGKAPKTRKGTKTYPAQPNGGKVTSSATTAVPAVTYKPTKKEMVALAGQLARRREAKPAPKVEINQTKTSAVSLSVTHEDPETAQLLLMESFGSADPAFVNGLLNGLLNVTKRNGQADQQALNFATAVIQGIQPRDELEAMLAAQLAAVFAASMAAGRHLTAATTIPQHACHEGALNRLTRTYMAGMETLKKYRSGGKQQVEVRHVHVHGDGPTNIAMGDIDRGGAGGEAENRKQPHVQALAAPSDVALAPVRSADAERILVPPAVRER